MYLSRLIFNPLARQVQRLIADPYELHRTVMRGFGDPKDGRVLFRLETGTAGQPQLLVQSLSMPDWTWLAEPEAEGWLLETDYPNPGTKPFELRLAAGQLLTFRLRANPTVRRRFPSGDHKRVGLYREEEHLDWLRRKADCGGFRPLSVHTTRLPDVAGRIQHSGSIHRLKMAAVQFDGLLRVTDPVQLRQTVARGVGSGKGLGFGLLSLAPATI
jgi:CRISPR system Cascade subunit CasE